MNFAESDEPEPTLVLPVAPGVPLFDSPPETVSALLAPLTLMTESLVSAPAVVKDLPPETVNAPWLVVKAFSAGKLAVGAPSVTLAEGAIVVTVAPPGKLSVPALTVQLPVSDE